MTNPISIQPKYLAPSGNWKDLVKNGDTANDEQKKDQEYIKDILLSSLQMQNLIVLTGCGTSRSVGGPSMKDLWDAAIGKPANQVAINIACKIKYELSTDNPNIEDFLSRCDAYLQVNIDDVEVQSFVNNCKKVILSKCSSFLDIKKLEGHKTFLHRLSRRRVRDPRLKIFTTNYDVCFERAAGDLGLVVIDGFSFIQPRKYDPRFFNYDIVRRPHTNEDQGSYLEGVFQIYKLHGSIIWARNKDGSIEEKQNPTSEEACLIYPAKGKYQQSFLQPHLELMSQYLAALREPNTCLIVTGFGFNDDHLSEPIISAVHSNPYLRLIIADFSAEKWVGGQENPSRYWKDFFDLSKSGYDIWFINASFPEFAKLIPNLKSLTQADRLIKDLQNITSAK